ncbi:MAG: hypothetical protein AAF203_05595 [Pseudomonadota bacterium]
MTDIALTWAQRAQSELGAAHRFKLLAEELADHGAGSKIVALARRAQEDEKRHVVICSELAMDMGHKTGFADFHVSEDYFKKPWIGKTNTKDDLLCEMTLMCCITETFNSSLLNTLYQNAENSPAKIAIHEILKDEIKHGQLGWAHLAEESQKRDIQFLSNYLAPMLEMAVKDELFAPVMDNDPTSMNKGVLPESLRLDQFKDTLEQVVLPGFEHFGLDTKSAKDWLAKKISLPSTR